MYTRMSSGPRMLPYFIYCLEYICYHQIYEAQSQTHRFLHRALPVKVEMACLLALKLQKLNHSFFGTVDHSFSFLQHSSLIVCCSEKGHSFPNWLSPSQKKNNVASFNQVQFCLSARLARKHVTSSLRHKDASLDQIKVFFNCTASQKRYDVIIIVCNILTMVEW